MGRYTRYNILLTRVLLCYQPAMAFLGKAGNTLLIAGIIAVLFALFAIVIAVGLFRRKQASPRVEKSENSTLYEAGAVPGFGAGRTFEEQPPWPWARTTTPGIDTNPATPVSKRPVTPTPVEPRAFAVDTLPFPIASQPLLKQPVFGSPSFRMKDGLGSRLIATLSRGQVIGDEALSQSQVSIESPIFIPDPDLLALMKQVQVGLFAMPKRHKD